MGDRVAQQVQRMVPERTTIQVPQQTMEQVQIQVPRQVPQEVTVMVPQTTTEMVEVQVPRQVVQEVQTHSVPMTSYETYQTVSQPMTMPAQQTYAAPTTSYAAPATTYAAPTYGTSMIGGYTPGYTG